MTFEVQLELNLTRIYEFPEREGERGREGERERGREGERERGREGERGREREREREGESLSCKLC